MGKNKYRLVEIFFVLALATKPLYLTKSGSIQISDVLYVLTAFAACNDGQIRINGTEIKFLKRFLLIIIYQVFINAIGPLLWNPSGQYEFLGKVNLYYVFNFIVIFCVFTVIRLKGFSRTVNLYIIGTILSIIISLYGVLTKNDDDVRVSGFFNNPNQLGYFCLVVLTVVIIYKKRIPRLIRYFCIVACSYMCLLSLSKAALVSFAFIFLLYFNDYESPINSMRLILSIVGIGIAIVIVYILLFANLTILTKHPYISLMRERMMNMMVESDSDLSSGRGFARIGEIGVCLIFGVGEGLYSRFTSLPDLEAHSAYVSTIVSYGIVGTVMYFALIKRSIYSRRYGLRYTVQFICIALYNVTHNGIRSTLFWTLIAMSYYEINEYDVSLSPTSLKRNYYA